MVTGYTLRGRAFAGADGMYTEKCKPAAKLKNLFHQTPALLRRTCRQARANTTCHTSF